MTLGFDAHLSDQVEEYFGGDDYGICRYCDEDLSEDDPDGHHEECHKKNTIGCADCGTMYPDCGHLTKISETVGGDPWEVCDTCLVKNADVAKLYEHFSHISAKYRSGYLSMSNEARKVTEMTMEFIEAVQDFRQVEILARARAKALGQ